MNTEPKMETIELHGKERETRVHIGGTLDILPSLLPITRVMIITDRQVYALLGSRLPEVPTFQVLPGDNSKSLRNASNIYRWLQEQHADRSVFLLGVGGGMVCDLTGFVAATYMRGVDFGLVPTQLLCQVDASIGGKNALNLYGFKNVIGTVYQPNFVLCDSSLLHSLPAEEVHGGLAEMIKHAMIHDATMFGRFEHECARLTQLEHPLIDEFIGWSIGVKKWYIEQDEYDRGKRRELNFGHTWGHAVEGVTGVHHGLAVAIGMAFATRLAVHLGICQPEVDERLRQLLTQAGLPTETKALPWVLYDALLRDKKRDADSINFVLPERIGSVVIQRIPLATLKDYIHSVT